MCTWRLCLCRWLDRLKLLLHSEHLYGLSPVWTLMCLFKCPDSLNVLSHMRHLYGFSPLWILLCLTSSPNVVNRLLQTVHSNGFSPEWLLMCTARSLKHPLQWPHSAHMYLPLWIFMCWRRLLWDEKHISHSLHKYTLSPVCRFLCIFKLSLRINSSRHTVHTCIVLSCHRVDVQWYHYCQLQSLPQSNFHLYISQHNMLLLLQIISINHQLIMKSQ